MSKYHVGYNLIKTVASPIKQAAETIKKTFVKSKKPKIGGQEKSKKIKEAVGIKKKVEKLEKQSEQQIKKGKEMLSRSDMVGPTKNLKAPTNLFGIIFFLLHFGIFVYPLYQKY